MTPYYDEAGITIYHAETLGALVDLELSIDGVVTDPPYSSGGAMRSDRMGSTVSKYVNSHMSTGAHKSVFATVPPQPSLVKPASVCSPCWLYAHVACDRRHSCECRVCHPGRAERAKR